MDARRKRLLITLRDAGRPLAWYELKGLGRGTILPAERDGLIDLHAAGADAGIRIGLTDDGRKTAATLAA